MRRAAVLPLPVLLLVACVSVGDSGAGTGPSVSQLLELGLTSQDELEGLATGLTAVAPGLPPAVTGPAGCPDSSNAADTDSDGIPDDVTLTFTDPPCSVSGVRGGTLSVTGSLRIQDGSAVNGTAYTLTFSDLAWAASDSGSGTRSYTAARNGTRVRTGTADAATVATLMTIVQSRPNRVNATISHDAQTTFTAATAGTLHAGQALPSGTLSTGGTMTWHRSTEDWTLTVETPTPLQYDATCTGTPQRFKAGQLALTGTVSGQDGTLLLTWSACGTDPARQWIPG